MKNKIAVSSCFITTTRYDGMHKVNNRVSIFLNFLKESNIHIEFICPEQLGGLSTPRHPSEILNERVINNRNEDVTEEFKRGAKNSLDIIRFLDIELALLKERSPSCGSKEIYDGSFSGKVVKGNGITSQLFLEEGIHVFSEEELYDVDFLKEYLDIDIEELKKRLNKKV